jgi:mannitol-1-phosphate 5-dehydrogenase
MPHIVIFGAGNIGRAFIGQVFARNGWNVVFIDVKRDLMDALQCRGWYPVVTRQDGQEDTVYRVEGVSGICSTNSEQVIQAVVQADCLATSVGMQAIPYIVESIADGLIARKALGREPVDIVLAENIHDAKSYFLSMLLRYLPLDFPVLEYLGIVQTSIGKMVPIITAADIAAGDPLIVASEVYNELILDAHGFLGPIPQFPEIKAVSDIGAYIDRKLFIHNLGHVAAAYLGNQAYLSETKLAQVLAHDELKECVKLAMWESAGALIAEYPQVFTHRDLGTHIENLLSRFTNTALGDTVFRVGRDLGRKLLRNDRVLGAIRLCEKHGLPWNQLAKVFLSAWRFSATDESGAHYTPDTKFLESAEKMDISQRLVHLCGMDPYDPIDTSIIEHLRYLKN